MEIYMVKLRDQDIYIYGNTIQILIQQVNRLAVHKEDVEAN